MAESLTRSRLDSFSDGVIAIIITIIVLELKVPTLHEMGDRAALLENLKILFVYFLTFVQIGIYWVNHHYLLDDLETVSHGVLWANLIFLFSLSLLPIGVEWIANRGIAPLPVAVYATSFVLPAVTWIILSRSICSRTNLTPAAGMLKQAVSSGLTLASIGVAFFSPWLSLALVSFVACLWLTPPKRIREKTRASRPARAPASHSS
jgi:uncharacterized membrane protein